MGDLAEVVITSDAHGASGTAKVWNLRTGTLIFTLQGGGISQTRSLCLLGGDYILSSEQSKPIIHIWPVNSHEPSFELRSICAGALRSLTTSPNGLWIAGAIEDKVHVWQAASGCLLRAVSGHYQSVSVLKFTDDSSHLISGGDDGMVFVWSIASIVDKDASIVEPVYRLTGHHLPVKDVSVGNGGMRARMASVSMDGTCQIVDLASGRLLLNLIHDKPLTAVTFIDTDLFLGDNEGNIRAVSLRDPPRQIDHHLGKENAVVLQGHTKAVTSLATSIDASILVSGSADECVRMWHVKSRHCIRTLEHKAPITNIIVTMTPGQMFENKFCPNVVLKKLQRNAGSIDQDYTIGVPAKKFRDITPPIAACELTLLDHRLLDPTFSVAGMPVNDAEHSNASKLEQINAQLYEFIVNKIISRTSTEDEVMKEANSKCVNVNEALTLIGEMRTKKDQKKTDKTKKLKVKETNVNTDKPKKKKKKVVRFESREGV